MNPEKNINPSEQLEAEEQAINEPLNVVTDDSNVSEEDEEHLRQEKGMADADDERNDLAAEDASFGERD